jgi:hypothetical protein
MPFGIGYGVDHGRITNTLRMEGTIARVTIVVGDDDAPAETVGF